MWTGGLLPRSFTMYRQYSERPSGEEGIFLCTRPESGMVMRRGATGESGWRDCADGVAWACRVVRARSGGPAGREKPDNGGNGARHGGGAGRRVRRGGTRGAVGGVAPEGRDRRGTG